jgi:hypothetical protein
MFRFMFYSRRDYKAMKAKYVVYPQSFLLFCYVLLHFQLLAYVYADARVIKGEALRSY